MSQQTRRRIVVGNHKGGAGKTAYVVNTAAALATRGHRVLVVDLDPQANASRRLGFRWTPDNPVPTVSEAIKADTPGIAAQAIYRCGWDDPAAERIDLIPARFDLENRISEAGTVGAFKRLRNALEGVDDEYDITLIDCPPSLGHLTQMALAAGDGVVIVVEPEYDGVEGAVRLRDFVTTRAADLDNPGLPIIGYVVSRYRRGLGAHAYQVDGFAELFGDKVWKPYVPERASIKDAADAAVPLHSIRGTGELVTVFDELAGVLAGELGIAR